MAKFSAILDQIDAGSVLLPEFQRGYVWNRDQVRGLMRSLYKGYPVGALLGVGDRRRGAGRAGGAAPAVGTRSLLLDGQQRVTTLYGVVRGTPPVVLRRRSRGVRGTLRFNVETEAFQFYGPVKMKDDPLWVDVTALFVDGPAPCMACSARTRSHPRRFAEYVDRLPRLRNVLEREVHVESITGADKTVDVVVDIFNRVNSGGTKLSKGDLALARICAEWGDARPTMRRSLDRWRERGLQFTPDWLLRNVNAVATGRAPVLRARGRLRRRRSATRWAKAVHNVDHLVDLIASTLGLDHDRVLMGRYAMPVLAPAAEEQRRPVHRRRRGGPRALLVRPRRGARSLRRIDRDAPGQRPGDRRRDGIDGVIPACAVPATAA